MIRLFTSLYINLKIKAIMNAKTMKVLKTIGTIIATILSTLGVQSL